MTTQLKYPVVQEKPFGLRRSSCPSRNMVTISSSDQAEDNSLQSSSNSVSDLDESREGTNPEWTGKTKSAYTTIA